MYTDHGSPEWDGDWVSLAELSQEGVSPLIPSTVKRLIEIRKVRRMKAEKCQDKNQS